MDFVNYLEKISGVDIYALISFMIFFLFFVAITLPGNPRFVYKIDGPGPAK